MAYLNGDCVVYSREFIQMLFLTCFLPFVRPNMPQLNQKDILAQREIEAELKKKQKQSTMASTKWGGPDPAISAAVNQLAGFTSDLRRIDDLKRLKENLLQAPP